MVRGHVGEPVFRSRVAQLAEQRLDKAQVDGSFPYARTRSSRCGAVGSARASGAWGRRFDACHRDQSDVRLGVAVAQRQSRGLWTCWCRFDSGRSPPSALAIERVANSSGRAPGSYPGWSEFEPLVKRHPELTPSWRNRQTHRSQKPAPTGMSVRLGPRGPRQSGSSTSEQRPHQAKAGGSSPPRTTGDSVSPVDATPRRAQLSARSWKVEYPPGVATALSAFQRRQRWRRPTTLPPPSVTRASLRSAALPARASAPTRRPAVQVRLTSVSLRHPRAHALREYLTSLRRFIVAATRSRRGCIPHRVQGRAARAARGRLAQPRRASESPRAFDPPALHQSAHAGVAQGQSSRLLTGRTGFDTLRPHEIHGV